MVARIDDERQIARRVGDLLNANNEGAAILGLKKLFVEELDFNSCTGSVPLHGQDLPASATRIAERGGVQGVAVRLTTRGRVLVRDIRSALKSVQDTLNGSILLVAGDAEGGEWQLVYPSTEGGKDILRRIVLHRGQPHRTVVEQLSKVYNQARHGDLRAALESIYDVEAVTKKFFERYRAVFDQATELVTGLEAEGRRIFVQTLFNRLMFIYFVQRKGWLTFNGNPDYLNALWRDATAKDENLYNERLKSLFFVGLNTPQGFDFDRTREVLRPLIGDVPFLNGGLFSETDLDRVPAVHVPNEAIGPLLEEVFGGFNFTIAESTPYDIQVAVDPEMLGKVFEELVTGRHETGSYYTPRPIVSFMCREALKGYLQREVPDLPAETVGRYVDEDDVTGITKLQAGRLLHALEEITVVDPACGSGAYLLGMMQELLEAENALYNPKLVADARSQYEMKLRIIQRNVYGVDIDPVAVNIAMLRLWLSLIIEYEGPGAPPPLPNLDFKIVLGDSLSGPDPSVPPSTLMEDAVQRTASELRELKELYTVAPGDEKTGLHRQVDAQQRALAEMMAQTDVPDDGVHWRVQFAEVFDRGGFDVVMANPPYVRADAQFKHLRDDEAARRVVIAVWKKYRAELLKSGIYQTLYEKWDLYLPFLERAYQLLRLSGHMIFIISDAYNAAKYARRSHAFFLSNSRIERLDFCSELPLFNAGIGNTILHFSKVEPDDTSIPMRIRHWGDKPASFSMNVEALPTAPQNDLGEMVFRASGARLVEAKGDFVRLADVCYISYGLRANADERHWLGEFTTDDCIVPKRDSDHPKSFVQGKDLAKWRPRDIWYLILQPQLA